MKMCFEDFSGFQRPRGLGPLSLVHINPVRAFMGHGTCSLFLRSPLVRYSAERALLSPLLDSLLEESLIII